MSWPDSELEYQAAFFSINDNNDKPTFKVTPEMVTAKESIEYLKEALG